MNSGKLLTRSTSPNVDKGDFVIIEVGDGRMIGTTQAIRNPHFEDQLAEVKDLKIPVGIYYTVDAQWYAENVRDLNDDTAWPSLGNDPSIDNLSWAIGTMRTLGRSPDFIILACRQRSGMPSPGWLYTAQRRVYEMAWKEWGKYQWAEFSHDYLSNKTWDSGLQGETWLGKLSSVSMRQIKSGTTADFEMFTLPIRSYSFWRYADGEGGSKLYQFYGDLAEYLGLTFETTPPIVLPTETPVTRAELDALYKALEDYKAYTDENFNQFAKYIAWLKECPR